MLIVGAGWGRRPERQEGTCGIGFNSAAVASTGTHLSHERFVAMEWQPVFGNACDLLSLCCSGLLGGTTSGANCAFCHNLYSLLRDHSFVNCGMIGLILFSDNTSRSSNGCIEETE